MTVRTKAYLQALLVNGYTVQGADVTDLIDSLTGHSVTKTTAYTLVNSDDLVLGDTTAGAFTITLPPTPTAGQVHKVKQINSTNILTVSGNGNLIDGFTSVSSGVSIGTQNYSWTFEFDGTFWWSV
jgi:hypothetical protein